MKIKEINFNEFGFPDLLKQIYDCPKKLYYLGNANNLNKSCVAIVGTRNSSKIGEMTARNIAYYFAKKGYVIISGLAEGIDKNAHIGALEANGKTIAVLGHGLNMIYPYSNRELAKKIIKNDGTLVTEYSTEEKIEKLNFANRNRIISGLSIATIVVEAKAKSGALITADFALEQGREVFAVPGRITEKNHDGCNMLLMEGASPITLEELEKF